MRWSVVVESAPPWLVSLVVHLAILLLLAWFSYSPGGPVGSVSLIVEPGEAAVGLDGQLGSLEIAAARLPASETSVEVAEQLSTNELATAAQDIARVIDRQLEGGLAPPAGGPKSPTPANHAEVTPDARFVKGGGLAGRGNRDKLRPGSGATAESERAMTDGLAWLAAHQLPNGAWHFDHRDSPCGGQCRNHGTVGTTTGATGLAILAFLSDGHTHKDGPYRDVVGRGLYYLQSRMLTTPNGGDLQEGTMYAQGIAAMALAEAFAMTEDPSLRPFAQSALDFIAAAQNSRTGGWRYVPGQPGDTTVLGWQVQSLRSGVLGGLEVSPATIYGASRYLDGVASGEAEARGAFYGYQDTKRRPTTTAIGLLCRMYTGWPRKHAALDEGTAYLSQLGPSKSDMYFNFYASQALHHYGGPRWDRWNNRMRDYLVSAQARTGHEAGSWHFDDPHGRQAGRVYTTAICTMILQVYYRYLPLYRESAVGE